MTWFFVLVTVVQLFVAQVPSRQYVVLANSPNISAETVPSVGTGTSIDNSKNKITAAVVGIVVLLILAVIGVVIAVIIGWIGLFTVLRSLLKL